jgi:hypothetical protein
VWLLIALMSAFLVISGIDAVWFLWVALSHQESIRSSAGVATVIALRLILVIALLGATASIYRRQPWSRWLGVLIIACLCSFSLLRPDPVRRLSEEELAGFHFGRYIVGPAVMVWWVYAFGLSPKARRYFAKDSLHAT